MSKYTVLKLRNVPENDAVYAEVDLGKEYICLNFQVKPSNIAK